MQLKADLGLPPGDYSEQAIVTETETAPRIVRIQ